MKAPVLLLAVLAGCDVEPPDLPPLDATAADARPSLDATADAGDSGEPACTIDGDCAPDQYCASGECRKRPTKCASTDDCASPDRCARPLFGTGTSTINPGLCKAPSRLRAICANDGECAAGEICTPAGHCGARAVAVAGNVFSACLTEDECGPFESLAAAGTLALVASCAADTDCGPAGLCDESAGECVACRSNADCPRQLTCEDGACTERATCSTDLHCFPANQCMSQRCVRRSFCRTDGGESPNLALRLEAALYQDLGLCSDRGVAWWSFDISGSHGARIALTSTKSEATLAMDLFDDIGSIVPNARWLALPGLTVVEVPAPGFSDTGSPLTRSLRIRVQSLDQAARYDLDLSRLRPLCPGDALDQYGDRTRSDALPIDGNRSYLATACPDDEDFLLLDAESEDQILLFASFPGSSTDLDLAVYSGSSTLALGSSTNTSTESLDTGRLAQSSALALRAFPKQAPSIGQDYQLDVTQLLGTFFRECADVTDLQLVNGSASVQGDLQTALDLGAPLCDNGLYAAPRRNDLLYRITPPSAPSLLRATITPGDSNSELTAAIVSECASQDATTRSCDSAELPRRALPIELLLTDANPIFLLVSSDGAVEDMTFDLDVLVEPVVLPANNSCAGAIDIAASGEIEVNTYGATNTVEATGFACGLVDGDAQGPDAFYRLRLMGRERAALELSGPRDGLIWIARDCGQMTATCTTAEAISYSDPVAQVALTPRNDTTFFIAVDGIGTDDRGIFTLRTVLAPECLSSTECGALRCDDYQCVPVPSNDTCTGAEPIALDAQGRATVIASTGAANDNLTLTCLGQSDRDVVYRIDLPIDRSSLTARVVEAKFDPALAIRRGQCEASLEEVCNDDVRFPDILLPEVTWTQPTAGSYYVIVDAYAGSGTFTLQIEAQE